MHGRSELPKSIALLIGHYANRPMTVIRRATLLDLKNVAIVVHAAYSGYITRIGREPGPMSDDYASLIRRGLVHVLDDGGAVGVVVLVPEPGTMLLDNVAVDPASQGKG